MSHPPVFWVIGGPNGSGKTTLKQRKLINSKIPVVNPDEIAAQISPNVINDNPTQAKAARMALKQREQYLKEKKSFAIETTLSGNSEIGLVKKAKAANYKINLVFVGVSKETSINRVMQRAQKGGHNVPKAIMDRRYERSMQGLAKVLPLADKAYILDNTLKHKIVFASKNQRMRRFTRKPPQWFKQSAIGQQLIQKYSISGNARQSLSKNPGLER